MAHPLAVSNLTVQFGGLVALDGLSFTVEDNEILGIIGPNGAGKSTLFDAITGLVPLVDGRVQLVGRDVTGLAPHARAALGLGRSFQDGRLFPSLTVTESVAVALHRHLPIEAPFSILAGGLLARQRHREIGDRVNEVLELMGLAPYAEAYVRELSTGTRRLVDLACALAHRPRVLLLDEPSSGVAQAETAQLGPLINGLRARTGCTILLIEHDIPLVTSISDRLLALESGTLVAHGRPAEVIEDPQVVSAYLGTERSLAEAVRR